MPQKFCVSKILKFEISKFEIIALNCLNLILDLLTYVSVTDRFYRVVIVCGVSVR